MKLSGKLEEAVKLHAALQMSPHSISQMSERDSINAGDTVYSQLLLAGVYRVLQDRNTHWRFLYIPATVGQDLISCLNLPNKESTLASLTPPDNGTFLDGAHMALGEMMLLHEQLFKYYCQI